MHEENWILLVVVLFVGAAIIIGLFLSHARRMKPHEVLEKSIDKGYELTPEILETVNQVKSPVERDLRRGIILISISIAFFVVSFIIPDDGEARVLFKAIALFPFFVGGGFLVMWLLNRNKD
ncbi:DUF6249 domain-containing protein [Marinicella sp. W31]|uniref:DUF6249 domain-containing protein n=1 Tax=Marinicella sp. W31 TaxID=3023713 RepID=UPI0037564FAA